jgi:hypothetical protein
VTTSATPRDRISDFDLLNEHAQEALRRRVADANGDIAGVSAAIQAQLDALDNDTPTTAAQGPAHQADRAFLVAQIAFLSLLEREQALAALPAKKQGIISRVRSTWRHARQS